MGGCASWRQGKEEDDALPTSLFQKGVNLEKFRLERETGLEPATPCLEGAAPSQRHTITLPFWRKVASGARSRAPIHKAEGRVTVNEPNEEQYTRSPAKEQRSYLRVPGQSRRVSARFRRASL
jgi:hypothetical protein